MVLSATAQTGCAQGEVLVHSPGQVAQSQIAHERVEKVTDYLSEGQVVRVKVLETDEKGRVKLSMKALLDRPSQQNDQG